MLMVLHLLALNDIFHVSSQSSRLCRSSWRSLQSSSEVTCLYSTQSSANRRTCELRAALGRSLIKARNNSGPSTVPCGTPESTCTQSEDSPSTTTLCRLFTRKASIQEWVLPRTPYLHNFLTSLWCGTLFECLWEIQYCHVYLGLPFQVFMKLLC